MLQSRQIFFWDSNIMGWDLGTDKTGLAAPIRADTKINPAIPTEAGLSVSGFIYTKRHHTGPRVCTKGSDAPQH